MNSENLISDAASFVDFKIQKPLKSFSLINPKNLEFSGDGTKVRIDNVSFTEENIPVPFDIAALIAN